MATKKKSEQPEAERLQKVLAHAGVASRRGSEELIVAGRVKVNGKVVTELGTKVNPGRDTIAVDGTVLSKETEKPVYVVLNKPRYVLSASSDSRKRKTVIDLVDIAERVYPVGRLDFNSEGLILLTNDGELTKKITHPGSHIEKEYQVLVKGKPSSEVLLRWRKGDVELDGKRAAPAKVKRMKDEGGNTWLQIVLTEGRKRQIREVAKIFNHHVLRLERVRIGPLKLGTLKTGRWRFLTQTEVQRLKQAVKKQ